MEKTGRIIRMPIIKRNGMQIATVQYDTPEADLCSIKSTDSRGGCPSCGGGCHACGKSDAEGLLAVQGNVVNALNVSGKDLWIGNKVGAFRGFAQSAFRLSLQHLLLLQSFYGLEASRLRLRVSLPVLPQGLPSLLE